MNTILWGDCRASLATFKAFGVKAQTCVTSPPYYGLRSYLPDGHPDKALEVGAEETPEQFIAGLVEVFRSVRDVLADTGTAWLNLGDTYGANKQLLGMPWRVALALQSDGWILRQDIVWAKAESGDERVGRAMPESVRDRCSKAHEYIFMLAKSPAYYFDNEAIKEPAQDWGRDRDRSKMRSGTTDPKLKHGGLDKVNHAMGNRRSVWRVSPAGFKGAHFAVYPYKLIEPCVLASTSERGHCPACGAIWIRQVERTAMVINKSARNEERGTRTAAGGTMVSPASSVTTGWAASCACGLAPVPDIVLDPFMGSGTTAGVALKHGRQYIGCELNRDYESLQAERIAQIVKAVA